MGVILKKNIADNLDIAAINFNTIAAIEKFAPMLKRQTTLQDNDLKWTRHTDRPSGQTNRLTAFCYWDN